MTPSEVLTFAVRQGRTLARQYGLAGDEGESIATLVAGEVCVKGLPADVVWRAWVTTIIQRRFVDTVRRERGRPTRRLPPLPLLLQVDTEDPVTEPSYWDDYPSDAQSLLDVFVAREQFVLEARLAGYSLVEIGAHLGVSPFAPAQTALRARVRARTALAA